MHFQKHNFDEDNDDSIRQNSRLILRNAKMAANLKRKTNTKQMNNQKIEFIPM